jgi:hypothetical protein
MLGTPRLELATQARSLLLAQEKVFGAKCLSRAEGETAECRGIQR